MKQMGLTFCPTLYADPRTRWPTLYRQASDNLHKHEAQLSPRDRAMRRLN